MRATMVCSEILHVNGQPAMLKRPLDIPPRARLARHLSQSRECACGVAESQRAGVSVLRAELSQQCEAQAAVALSNGIRLESFD